jgi:hypothetical protein
LEVDGAGQAAERVVVEGVVGPGTALLAVQQPGLDQLLEVVADGGLAEPERAGELAYTDRVGVANRLTILTRCGSARALNSRAVATASLSDSEADPRGAQHAGAVAAVASSAVVVNDGLSSH